ncbi:MAG: hypothetical protein EOO05_22195 [Chitinophagaceae bacterium]|nr:MAG: hypothetical protein EOO05_22195 [Chitinophagaceae bacterium]
MKTQHNINRTNNPIITTREPETDIIKGASDTSTIDATRDNALKKIDPAGTTPEDIYGVLNGEHPNNEEHIKKEDEGDNPLIDGI